MDANVVIVTGANDGIGLYTVGTLLEDGYRVAGLDLGVERMQRWRPAHPETFLPLVCDVTEPAQVERAVAAVVERFGRVDILFNNACVLRYGTFAEKPPDEARHEIEVNFWGYLNLIRAVLPVMKAQGGGIVHNVSSAIGITGFPRAFDYTASKGAVEALTRTLRMEYAGTGIHFTLLHPPLTDTASAAPLAVRRTYMDRPETVGQRFAKKARSTRGIIFADVKAWAFDVSAHLTPDLMGRIFATQSEKYSSRNI